MIHIDEINIDEVALKDTIAKAKDLNDNEQMFGKLAEVSKIKKTVADALELLDSIEREAKYEIDARAKALYGTSWQAITGTGYKITRSFTGTIYALNPEIKPAKKFLKITESVDTKAVDAEVETTGKLPKGIEYNPARGTMIRVTLK